MNNQVITIQGVHSHNDMQLYKTVCNMINALEDNGNSFDEIQAFIEPTYKVRLYNVKTHLLVSLHSAND